MNIKGNFGRQAGQGMTEHIIIVAMIALAAIAVYQHLGQTVRNQTAAMLQALAGEDGSTARAAATAANTKNTLEDYVNQKAK